MMMLADAANDLFKAPAATACSRKERRRYMHAGEESVAGADGDDRVVAERSLAAKDAVQGLRVTRHTSHTTHHTLHVTTPALASASLHAPCSCTTRCCSTSALRVNSE